MNSPKINVTPLIDVLLVLLIIFMVVSPLKPSSFKARVPQEQKNDPGVQPNIKTLAIIIGKDGSLRLNSENDLGSASDAALLIERLKTVFSARIANGDISEIFGDDPDRPMPDRIERTVFIKAPRTLDYGSVARVIDAAKIAGAYPISLQIDDLE